MLDQFQAYLGPAAGLATSILWTATAVSFTAAGRRIGPTAVNACRIGLAIVLLGTTHYLIYGRLFPQCVPLQIGLLAASGILGLSIGDQALFTSFVYIGPRLAMLIMTTSPIMAALFGWVVLGEQLSAISWLGIGLTISGVAWVVLERQEGGVVVDDRKRAQGIILALVGALFQAGGFLLSKQGIGHGWLPDSQHMAPQAAAFVRMIFGGLGMAPIIYIRYHKRKKLPPSQRITPNSRDLRVGLAITAAGAVVGPFLGMWMSLEAADRTPLGVAQTLISLPPVFILPLSVLVFKERVSWRAVAGAIVAVGGSTLLFFSN